MQQHEDRTTELLLQAIATLNQTAVTVERMEQEIREIKSQLDVETKSNPVISDHLTPDQACKLINCERHKLADLRKNRWIEGVHYFPQPNRRYLYNGVLLADWLKNNAYSLLHQAAVDQWMATQPAQQPKKTGRKRAS